MKRNIVKYGVCGVLVIVLVISIKLVFLKNNPGMPQKFGTSETTEKVEAVEKSTNLNIAEVETEEYTEFNCKIDLSDLTTDGDGVKINENVITINKAGIYYFTGKLEDGNVIVEASKDDKIVLVFENAEITSLNTAAVSVLEAKEVTINLVKDSENIFTDGSEHAEDDAADGTIFSKSDLYITGKGTLKINANYKDGIVSKDTLAIVDCNLEINSKDDGIKGKDYISIKGANITTNSKGDGIKSTNDTDETLGYIIIANSELNITSESDAIQAETVLNIADSDITIKTTGEVAQKTNEIMRFKNPQETAKTTESSAEEDSSSKGLKAGKEITINGGNLQITSTDDSIHSNGYIIIADADFEISAEDDGIHADNNVLINNGKIDITKSNEGIEGNYIKINDGDISVIASDDGINISGGDGSENMAPMSAGTSGDVAEDDKQLVINGGKLYVKSNGDGLDSNGSIVINGGEVIVSGTTSGGNCALDYDKIFNVNGGTLIIYGSTDMWQNPSNSSKQYSICFGVSGNQGDSIVLKDSAGNEIVSFKTDNSYSAIMISSEDLKNGENYTLYVNEKAQDSQKITSIITSNLTSSNRGMNGQDGMQGRERINRK